MRNWKAGVYIETGFDRTAHKVDVRRVSSVTTQNISTFCLLVEGASKIDTPNLAIINAFSQDICAKFQNQ